MNRNTILIKVILLSKNHIHYAILYSLVLIIVVQLLGWERLKIRSRFVDFDIIPRFFLLLSVFISIDEESGGW